MQLAELFSALEAEGRDRRYPPVHRWKPEHTGRIDVHIGADGTWYHEGAAFKRPSLVKLLASVLLREGEHYFLVSPHEKLRISVADVPLLATDFETRGEGAGTDILFSTNGGDHVVVDAEHPLFMRKGKPYIHVRDGIEALIARPAFYRLVERGESRGDSVVLWSRGSCFELHPDDHEV
jgi:hypothetical protein